MGELVGERDALSEKLRAAHSAMEELMEAQVVKAALEAEVTKLSNLQENSKIEMESMKEQMKEMAEMMQKAEKVADSSEGTGVQRLSVGSNYVNGIEQVNGLEQK